MNINPIWQNAFRGELSNNLRRKSNDFTKQLYMIDVATECVMYACDMCLHYYKEGAFYGITPQTIDNISYNVCYAMHDVVKEFNSNMWDEVQSKVKQLMTDSTTYEVLQEEIDNYYSKF